MKTLRHLAIVATAAACFTAPAVNAASVSLLPGAAIGAPGDTLLLELVADFTGIVTVGGGLDFAVSGPIEIIDFQPSAFFLTLAQPGFPGCSVAPGDFTNCGTLQADADFEVHVGSFFGFTGNNSLGVFEVGLLDLGEAAITININTIYGDFFALDVTPIEVALNGASISVVPVPAAAWLFASALGFMVWMRRRSGVIR